MNRPQLLKKIDEAWAMFQAAYLGLSDGQMTEPGVTGDWSVRDVLANVTVWEEEALKYLPLILDGGEPPHYSVKYGGIDAFNALMLEQKRKLSLSQVLDQLTATHRRIVNYIESVPEKEFVADTPFRRRLRLYTYSHYPIHTRMIREWREQSAQ
jgi:hypothetical protein